MSVFVRNAGVWKRTVDVHVNVGGIWKSTVATSGGTPIGGSKVKITAGWEDATAAEKQTAGVITIGSDFLYQTYTYGFNVVVYGFNTADDDDYDWSLTAAFGSMTLGADFWDSRGIDRNIAAVYHGPSRFEGPLDLLAFSLIGTNIPNDDRTFYSIQVDDGTVSRTRLRSDATYDPDTNGGTTWYWAESFGFPFATSGTMTVTMRFKDSQ